MQIIEFFIMETTKLSERRKLSYLSDSIAKLLIDQVGHEHTNETIYKNMAIWCSTRGLEGHEIYFNKRSEDETSHMNLIIQHLVDSDYEFIIPKLEEKPIKVEGDNPYDQVYSLHEKTLETEIGTTEKLLFLTKKALEEGDYITFNALQFLVTEQKFEEVEAHTALDQFAFTKDLMLIDKKIGELLK